MTIIDILILTAALLAIIVVLGIVTLANGSPAKASDAFWAFETQQRHPR